MVWGGGAAGAPPPLSRARKPKNWELCLEAWAMQTLPPQKRGFRRFLPRQKGTPNRRKRGGQGQLKWETRGGTGKAGSGLQDNQATVPPRMRLCW